MGRADRAGAAQFRSKIGGGPLPRDFIAAVALIKAAAARANARLGLLPADMAGAIQDAVNDIAGGEHQDQFPLDVFQTGSGTSTNMNVNEVIAHLASKALGKPVHPNDHVNMCQSSNDVIPSAIHLSALSEAAPSCYPALEAASRACCGRRSATGRDVSRPAARISWMRCR